MQTRRIFWQMFAGHLAVTLFTLLVFLAIFSSALEKFHRREVADGLEAQARIAARLAGNLFTPERVAALGPLSEQLGVQTPARVTMILPDGTVAGESDKSRERMENHRTRPEVQTALDQRQIGRSVRFSDSVRKNMLYVAVPVLREDGSAAGVVRLAMPLMKLDETLGGLEHGLLGGALAVLLLAGGLSLLLSQRMSRPLEYIKEGAARFAAGDFSERLHADGSAEICALSDTMNEMAAQLEDRLQTVVKECTQRDAILSSMVEGVLAVDTSGRILSLNTAAARFFRVVHPETAPGRSIEEVFRNIKLQRFVAEVLASGESRECELVIEDGPTCCLQARGTTLAGPQGRRIGAVVVLNDVSRLRRLENLRREFVANVSHELKTPITSIKGFVETLLDGAMKDPVEAERFLKIVARHADRLNAIIEDLLMLSRLEQGGKEGLELQKAGLGGILNSAVEVCSQRAAEKQITVRVDCPPSLTAKVNPPLIEQALINLIGNAIKYSAADRQVEVSACSAEGGVRIAVRDQGYGIEEKHLERLFERFYRVDKGRSRQEGGTGLGLSIVKHIAQAHGGTVSVQSRYGEGSIFSIFLPTT
jgi:two-component system phosphate regulon sensor histidine kinase PhoR